jgi:hypothetical protein
VQAIGFSEVSRQAEPPVWELEVVTAPQSPYVQSASPQLTASWFESRQTPADPEQIPRGLKNRKSLRNAFILSALNLIQKCSHVECDCRCRPSPVIFSATVAHVFIAKATVKSLFRRGIAIQEVTHIAMPDGWRNGRGRGFQRLSRSHLYRTARWTRHNRFFLATRTCTMRRLACEALAPAR